MNSLLPAVTQHLVLDVGLHSEGAICDLLMDMIAAIVAEHIDVESIFGIFIVEPGFGEIAFIPFFGGFILPIAKAIVDCNFISLAEMEKKVWFVHAEIANRIIFLFQEALRFG